MILRAFGEPRRQERVNIISLHSKDENRMELMVVDHTGTLCPGGLLLILSSDGLFLPKKIDPAFGFIHRERGGLLVVRE